MLKNQANSLKHLSAWRAGSAWRALLLAAALLSPSAQALTVNARPFPELVQEAEVIVVGTVAGMESAWSADHEAIQTTVRLVDLDLIKGEVPAIPYEVRLAGGVVGDTAQVYPGMPRLVTGGRYVLFVRGNLRDFFPLVGAYQGLYRVLTDADGQQRVLRADQRDTPVVRALTLPAQPTLEEFTARIRDQLTAPDRTPAP
jgi:hypothetical protein